MLTRFQTNLEWFLSLLAEDMQTQFPNKLKPLQGFYHLKNVQERKALMLQIFKVEQKKYGKMEKTSCVKKREFGLKH